jgi:hypothetical protein
LAKSPKIRKPTTEPVEYEPCIVAFIDVLGFRDLVNSRSAADVQDAISALQHFTTPDKEELSKSDRRLFSQAQARSVSDAVVRIRPYVTEYRDGALVRHSTGSRNESALTSNPKVRSGKSTRKDKIRFIFQLDMAEGEELGSNLLHVDQRDGR